MQEQVYIHLAEKRQHFEHFSVSKYINKEIFDITLKPKERYPFKKDRKDSLLILPFLGDLGLETENFNTVLEENKALVLGHVRQQNFEIINDYESDNVNFIMFPIQSSNLNMNPFDNVLINIAANKNYWHTISTGIFISQWTARKKGHFDAISRTYENLIVYCLSGAFEVNDRLLQAKDSLEIVMSDGLDFEALAEDSILFILEKNI
jgi:quercetin 2,3-dioxygenase